MTEQNATEALERARAAAETARDAAETAQAAADAVAFDRIADLLRHRVTDARRAGTVGRLKHESAPRHPAAFGDGQKLGAFLESWQGVGRRSLDHKGLPCRGPAKSCLGAQPLAALGAAAENDLTTVFGCHAAAKAVATLADETARLESALHCFCFRARGARGPDCRIVW